VAAGARQPGTGVDRWATVPALDHLTPLDARYPSRLHRVGRAPASITLQGGEVEAEHAVAIVGSREATAKALEFARELAAAVARTGAAVVSGGARGIDAAAHQGAMDAGGRTWAIAATGHEHCYPPEHAALFETIARGPGAMLWPFAPAYDNPAGFLRRNRLLVAMVDAVVVVQAGLASGALNAANWARKLQRPLWVVPAPPWAEEFGGSRQLLDLGALPLTSSRILLESLGLPGSAVDPATLALPPPPISDHESAVLAALSSKPLHLDTITALAGQSCAETSVALLTLALENVVVEGPPGFFRRRDRHNA
jgi:DNA processing protein